MQLTEKVLAGHQITLEEARFLMSLQGSDLYLLLAMANKIKEKFAGSKVDLCSVINARSGKCSEDCAFCAQSIHHNTKINTHELLSEEEFLTHAREIKKTGANRFSIVTSGKGVDKDFSKIVKILKQLEKETRLKICASLGILDEKAVEELKQANVSRYHHNLETAPSFFDKICTTHSYEDRVKTVRLAKEAGMEVCCGGIIGLGETPEQRIELAFFLRDLDVDSVPINVLNPVPGTPLEKAKPLSPLEILKTIAVFRFILPDKILRYAGGREVNLRDLQAMGLVAGINGILIGNYLTTYGRNPEDDIKMIKDLELTFERRMVYEQN